MPSLQHAHLGRGDRCSFNFTGWFISHAFILCLPGSLLPLPAQPPGADKIAGGTRTRHLYVRYPWPAQGSADADEIPARAMIAHMGRTRVGLTQTRYPQKPCMERTRVG
ncbi:hypothetical protein EV363DRAFT_1162220 [Boletus edulis]|nr:hypothetical protein EV363DRAFT_1162220 [Boletus edulis]